MAEQIQAIRPIQTRYAGCRFRSRLEARWAVYFDRRGWSWQYEPEGFELPSGRYLPDFLVDAEYGHGLWLEVKGQYPDRHELQLARELANASGRFVDVIYGDIPRSVATARPALSFSPQGILPDECYPMDSLALFETDRRPGHASADEALIAARSARFEFEEA